MKFIAAFLLLALVAASQCANLPVSNSAPEPLEPKDVESDTAPAAPRDKRGLLYGAYAAPYAAAYSYPYVHPVAYSAPIAYAGYRSAYYPSYYSSYVVG